MGRKDLDRKIKANQAAHDRDDRDDDHDRGQHQTDQHGRTVPITLPTLKWMQKPLPDWWDEKPMRKNGNGRSNDLAARVRPHLERLEELDAEKAARWKEINDEANARRKLIYDAARQDGLEVGSLKALRQFRKLDRKKEAIRARLNVPEAEQLTALADAFAGTDFGEHIRARAEEARVPARANGARPNA
jgi:uncharacterized protein (UPF0335 family)